MNKSAKTWLLFMMIPFFVGVIIYFMIPLLLIVSSNPKLQGAFNGYKIEVQQNTVRALSFLNSRIAINRMQMYRNTISTFIKLMLRTDMSNYIDITSLQLNSAQKLSTSNNSIPYNADVSMWYSTSTSTSTANAISNFTTLQQQLYNTYLNGQPYLQSLLSFKDDMFKPVIKITTIFQYNNNITGNRQQFYFQYPTQNISTFINESTTVMYDYYNKTLNNNYVGAFNTTTFDMGQAMRICVVMNITFNQSTSGSVLPNGVVCMDLLNSVFAKDVISALNTPQFQLSTNQYYYLRPIYICQASTDPLIFSNFTSDNLSNINIPVNQRFSLQQANLPTQLFRANRRYFMNIQRFQHTQTYYTIPITVVTEVSTNFQVILYLVVLNNFAQASLSQQSRSERIAIIMVVPSVVLLIISIIVTSCILKSIFSKLDQALKSMQNYCSLIKRGDLQLQIPEYSQSQDLRQLFAQLSKLNQLNKYSDYSYFNVPKPQRILRLLKCLKLFDELGYNKTALYQNISQCYVDIGDQANAVSYMRMSINNSIKDIYGDQSEIDKRYNLKLNQGYKTDKNMRKKEKALMRKLLKLGQLLFTMHNKQNNFETQIFKNSQILKRITYPDILNYQYIGSVLFMINYNIKTGNMSAVPQQLQTLHQLLQGYTKLYQNGEQGQVPPQIIYSYWYLISANMCMNDKKFVQAFQFCVKALQNNRYNPIVHTLANSHIQKILQIYKIPVQQFKSLKYHGQYKQSQNYNKQYIFLIDVSKPQMSTKQVSNWKRKARSTAQYILENLVQDQDRVSITEFCTDIKILCNLVQKKERVKMLKKELMSAIKAREQTIVGDIAGALRKSIQRVKNLKNQRVFLMFLKGKNLAIDASQLCAQLKQVQNCKLIILTQDMNVVTQRSQQCFTLQYGQQQDLNRILQTKIVKHSDNIVYIF